MDWGELKELASLFSTTKSPKLKLERVYVFPYWRNPLNYKFKMSKKLAL